MRRLLLFWVFVLSAGAAPGTLDWVPWSDEVFARARREDRFVLLDLEAVWCHWCHVMDATTYRDPEAVELLRSKYITIKVDQDARPDLATRYEDYGWPATVVFDREGREIVKRQGYIAPREMTAMLRAILADPSPGPSVTPAREIRYAQSPVLAAELRAQLEANYRLRYDTKNGSWGFQQKFLDWDGVEYAMRLARQGDRDARKMALQTLTEQLNLLDPAWGGVYQYSTGGGWKHPHFEKIMQFQAENMRIYALAYRQFHRPEYLRAALSIRRFMRTFLTSPDGAFYTSQDADLIDGKHSAAYFKLDDAGRRRLGIPRVDRHIYARENGWAIGALAVLYQASGGRECLEEAERAARWTVEHRAIENGGFRHDENGAAGPYLGDTLAMTRAFLNLHAATGEAAWLEQARAGLEFIAANFRNTSGAGYVASRGGVPERDENVALARAAIQAHIPAVAAEAMRYVVTPQIAREHTAAPVLLAAAESTLAQP